MAAWSRAGIILSRSWLLRGKLRALLGFSFRGRGQIESFFLRIVVEQLAIPSPVQDRIQLALNLGLRLMFVQDIAEELERDAVIGLLFQDVLNLLEEQDARKRGLAKHSLLVIDIGLNPGFTFGRNV